MGGTRIRGEGNSQGKEREGREAQEVKSRRRESGWEWEMIKKGKKGHRFSEDWEKRRRTRWQMCQTMRSQGRRTLGHPGEQEDAWRSQTTLVFEGGI